MEIVLEFIKPKRLPEANIQAELYRQLRNRNIKCCLEYRIYIKSINTFIRADIVIIHGNKIIMMIECKSRKESSKPKKSGKQYQSYIETGVPFLYCMTFRQVPEIVNKIISLPQFKGVVKLT